MPEDTISAPGTVEIFLGTMLILVPHMDDGILACGGIVAKLPNKESIHVLYATDGMRSPAPIIPWRDSVSPELNKVRISEARAAMGYLGVLDENIHFLNLPDSQLKRHITELKSSLIKFIANVNPDVVLYPFRYDRHPDHIALNHALMQLVDEGFFQGRLLEYFVYYRWRLLPEGDVRAYIRPEFLFQVDIVEVSESKRRAFDYFKSQTTRYYDWQTRPNLTPELLDEVSHTPEYFFKNDQMARSGAAIFSRSASWIRIAHRLEPSLKKIKDQLVALWRGAFQNNE